MSDIAEFLRGRIERAGTLRRQDAQIKYDRPSASKLRE